MRHFFAARWKARTWREGHTWEKGGSQAPKAGTFTQGWGGRHIATWNPEFRGSRGSEGVGRGPWSWAGGCEGRLPAASRESGKGGAQTGCCPAYSGRVPTATARGRKRRRGRLARGSPPSLRERKCGGPAWGPGGLGRAGGASRTRGPPRMLLALLGAPPRGRLRGATEARARCRLRWPRG